MQTIEEWCITADATDKGKSTKAKRRRRPGLRKTRPLTPKQVEAVQAYGDCEGNVSAAAKRVGVARNTYLERLNAAYKKLGKAALKKPATRALSEDNRQQVSIAGQDNGPAALPQNGENPKTKRDRRHL
jgi:predicted DNA-binding protein (UPF0251 family)